MTVDQIVTGLRAQADKCKAKSIAKVAVKVEEIELLLEALVPDDPVGREVFSKLNLRERRIVEMLVASGASNATMAAEIGTTVQTIKNNFGKIFQKTGMGSRVELLQFIHAHPAVLGPKS